jgi:hypothetical protein
MKIIKRIVDFTGYYYHPFNICKAPVPLKKMDINYKNSLYDSKRKMIFCNEYLLFSEKKYNSIHESKLSAKKIILLKRSKKFKLRNLGIFYYGDNKEEFLCIHKRYRGKEWFFPCFQWDFIYYQNPKVKMKFMWFQGKLVMCVYGKILLGAIAPYHMPDKLVKLALQLKNKEI